MKKIFLLIISLFVLAGCNTPAPTEKANETAIPTPPVAEETTPAEENKEAQLAPTQKAEEEQEARSLADCTNLDNSWSLFQSNKTSLSFCYKQAWGTPELKEGPVSKESYEGEIWFISFSKSTNDYPLIRYRSKDFHMIGDTKNQSLSGAFFANPDFSKSESELARLFLNTNATAQKLIINGQQVLKVKRNFIDPVSYDHIQSLDYFIPNVAINGTMYNLDMSGLSEQESDLGKLLESMRF